MNLNYQYSAVLLGLSIFFFSFFRRNDDEEQGMVVKETSSGLRLKALEYWRCSEQGLSLTESSHTDPDKPAFVFAEAISGPGNSKNFNSPQLTVIHGSG